ncbi:MAG: tRNA glutamyl-Q(34) synthetase GluQRS, partial [Acidobacteriota bacterium]|nr:tRNA glutamyl-Q(34) synthetase GluQRS [Acidobacteriota bacterium]
MTVCQESIDTQSARLLDAAAARPLRGRYAPSPTGEMHLGNASTALLAWLSIRSRDGKIVMRMEDLDQPRVSRGAAEQILTDLKWLGLDWDEGPDVGGPFAPYEQSRRFEHYDTAFRLLVDQQQVYPCFCSRRDIAEAASAPQTPGDEIRYPGTCRNLDPPEIARRTGDGERHAWRFRVEENARPTFVDEVLGIQASRADEPPGDFVVRRADAVAAYQLAVVVDDAEMAITEVVRGDDLVSSTVRQLLLYEAIGRPCPTFGHVPLLLGPDGVRLSKRHQGVT